MLSNFNNFPHRWHILSLIKIESVLHVQLSHVPLLSTQCCQNRRHAVHILITRELEVMVVITMEIIANHGAQCSGASPLRSAWQLVALLVLITTAAGASAASAETASLPSPRAFSWCSLSILAAETVFIASLRRSKSAISTVATSTWRALVISIHIIIIRHKITTITWPWTITTSVEIPALSPARSMPCIRTITAACACISICGEVPAFCPTWSLPCTCVITTLTEGLWLITKATLCCFLRLQSDLST
mmetsp:Transcript_12825/g.24160  ORF Transcript_12825/g.24160 Transcript_12825/m.24160 type:complete len:248 (+) Transcript_12825:689-1432(+)